MLLYLSLATLNSSQKWLPSCTIHESEFYWAKLEMDAAAEVTKYWKKINHLDSPNFRPITECICMSVLSLYHSFLRTYQTQTVLSRHTWADQNPIHHNSA